MTETFKALCPICSEERLFESADNYWSGRDGLKSKECPLNTCVTRERALATVLFSIFSADDVKKLRIHEAAPIGRGISLWIRQNVSNRVATGYFPEQPFGTIVGHLRNEDLEKQTFEDGSFDVVVHLDVMEHLFKPFDAIAEIYRTLAPGGVCLFTAPTYPERLKSEQVAFLNDGKLTTVGEPEYHGNPQSNDGSLVTWRYGYDLPKVIVERTPFVDVEVRRWYSRAEAIFGIMTEVYILRRERDNSGVEAGLSGAIRKTEEATL